MLCGINSLVSVGSTCPFAVNSNGKFYAEINTQFLVGTAIGYNEKLIKDKYDEKYFCVIVSNIYQNIVSLQAGSEILANNVSTAFKIYKIRGEESHQEIKSGNSGAASAIVDILNQLRGDYFQVSNVLKIRDNK